MSYQKASAWGLCLALGVPQVYAQTQVDLRTQSKSVDFAGAASTRPFKTGPSLPPTCEVGELFFRTGVAAGSNLYGCTSANQWSLEASGGGGGGSLPDMAGQANKVLSTDGAGALWRAITTGPSGALEVSHAPGDISVDIVTAVVPQKSAANTFTGLNTFSQGVQLGEMASPASPADGRIWYDSASKTFRCRQNGATYDCIGSGGGGGGGLGDPGSNGVVVRTGLNLTTARTIQGTANRVSVTNGDGVSGNPTVDIGSDVLTAASTHTLTNKTIDAEASGNQITLSQYVQYQAANCQGTTASLGFATASTGAPTAACVSGSNTVYGVAQFADSGPQSVQGNFSLPPDWTGNIDLDLRWRSSATSGSVVWQLQTACAAEGGTGDPAWNSAQTITDAAKAGPYQFNDAALSAITTTGCAAGGQLFFKFFRDPAHAADTLGATAELLWIRFKLRRTQ